MNKEYIGDSVYVELVDGMIRLTTENGGPPSNEIFLEPEVFNALKRWASQDFNPQPQEPK